CEDRAIYRCEPCHPLPSNEPLSPTLACSHSLFFFYGSPDHRDLHSFPTRRSSDLEWLLKISWQSRDPARRSRTTACRRIPRRRRSEEHTSELQSRSDLVCRLLLEKKKKE